MLPAGDISAIVHCFRMAVLVCPPMPVIRNASLKTGLFEDL